MTVNWKSSMSLGTNLLLLGPTFALSPPPPSSINKRTVERNFRFVPYGSSAPEGITTITCDGRVPGATLEVTHWTGNETPDNLYADTSTEMAMNLAKQQQQQYDDDRLGVEDAVVINNHYDTDGVLSCYTCMKPSQSLEYEKLFIQGAEAGDFGEWSSDAGVKLDCAILELLDTCNDDEAKAYQKAFEVLPELAHDIVNNDGSSFEDLWRPGFDVALEGWNDLEIGRAKLYRSPASPNIVILEERVGSSMSPYSLHRGLVENDLWEGTTRILRVQRSQDNTSFQYNYEKIGHGWVQKLVDRHMVPGADGESLAVKMNNHCSPNGWKSGGISGLVSICYCRQPSDLPPEEVAKLLSEYEIQASD